MVIATCGEKRGRAAESLCDVESKDAVIEAKRALKVGHLQVDVPHSNAWVNRCIAHVH
jgi:hypothetical protein